MKLLKNRSLRLKLMVIVMTTTCVTLVAALIGVMAAFVLLQFGVLAACTWHVPRSAS